MKRRHCVKMRMSLFFHETGKQVAVVSPFDVSFWLNLHCRMRFYAAKGYLLPRVSWPFTTRNMAVYSTKSGFLRRRLPPFGTFAASFSCTLCLPWGVTPLLPATYDCTRYFRSYASLCHDFSGDALQEASSKIKKKAKRAYWCQCACADDVGDNCRPFFMACVPRPTALF